MLPNFDYYEYCTYRNNNNIRSIYKSIQKSKNYGSFSTRKYSSRGKLHLAPRFGIFQMQRAGSKQHPTQLQFNLKAGYFYVI